VTLSNRDLDAYFNRIGYAGSWTPTLDMLCELQRLHATTFPFENLDVVLGRPVRLDKPALIAKLIAGRRGGYCFEQNGLLAAVLTGLGFTVTPLAARVRLGVPDGVATGRTHMLLKVMLDSGPYIVDVGFGGLNPTAPFALVLDMEQPTPLETYRFIAAGDGFEMQAELSGTWTPLYRFTEEPQVQIDYEIANWFISTSPASRFVQNLTLARPSPDRRAVVLNDRLTIRYRDGKVEESTIDGVDGLRRVMAEHFDLDLFAIAGAAGANAIVERYFPRGTPTLGAGR
jgi:N-hydroxyarylamine O-acetyltransferase